MDAVHGPVVLAAGLLGVRMWTCPRRNAASGATMIPVIVAEVLDELAHDIPHLPGASCRGRAELFDVADRHDPAVERAKAVCASCPALRDCRAWLAGLPRLARPCGVVAGRYVAPPKLRPAYEPRPRTPSSRDRVTDWLRAYLAARGPVLSTEVIADAAAAGISCSTLYKARIALNVRLQRCAPHVAVVNPGLRIRSFITKIKSVRTAAKASGPGFERVTHFCYAPEGLLIVRLLAIQASASSPTSLARVRRASSLPVATVRISAKARWWTSVACRFIGVRSFGFHHMALKLGAFDSVLRRVRCRSSSVRRCHALSTVA